MLSFYSRKAIKALSNRFFVAAVVAIVVFICVLISLIVSKFLPMEYFDVINVYMR